MDEIIEGLPFESGEVWVVAYYDRSAIYLATNELRALRLAVDKGCPIVRRVPVADDAYVDLLEVIA